MFDGLKKTPPAHPDTHYEYVIPFKPNGISLDQPISVKGCFVVFFIFI